jgi:hypothetical protein
MGYQLGFYMDFRRLKKGVRIRLIKYKAGVMDLPEEVAGLSVRRRKRGIKKSDI